MSTSYRREGAGDQRGDAAQRRAWSYAVSACIRLSCVCLYTPPTVGMHVSRHVHHVVLLLWAGAVLLFSSVLALGDGGSGGGGGGEGKFSEGWSVDHLPSPTLDPVGCGHPGGLRDGSFVCDPDGLLTQEGARRVDDELDAISSLESPCGGVEGGVAVVSRMTSSPPPEQEGSGDVLGDLKKKRSMPGSGLGSGGSGGVTAEGFARGVHDAWRVGKKGCDNGFLLVASREDRSFAISVGKGLERYLAPRDRNAALNAMKPLLRKGDWDAAVLVALEEISKRLRKNLPGEDKASGAATPTPLPGGRWGEFKQRLVGAGGGRGGEGGGGGGGGGGGLFGGSGGGFFESWWHAEDWPQLSPGSMMLAMSLLCGGAAARASANKRRYSGFEAKLAGIEAQRTMMSLAPGGWSVGQNALASAGSCPICLDTFSASPPEKQPQQQQQGMSAAGGYELGHGGEVTGSDGLAVVTVQCGHSFCQSCLSQWHGDDAGPAAADSSHAVAAAHSDRRACPICDEDTPALTDERLGLRHRRHPRRRAPHPKVDPNASHKKPRRRRNVGSFGFSWPGTRRATGPTPTNHGNGSGGGGGGGGIGVPCNPHGSNIWGPSKTSQGVLPPPPPPPPPLSPPPPPPPLNAAPVGGTPDGIPLTPVGARPAGAAAQEGGGMAGALRSSAGSGGARDRARREAAFRLASLGSQYPKFLDDRTVNRWLSKDYSSSWSRDPLLALNRPPEMGTNRDGGGSNKGSGWVSSASRIRDYGGGERRSYGGGSSSTATGGGW